MLIIADGLQAAGEGTFALHPALNLPHAAYELQWFDCVPRVAAELEGWLRDAPAVACVLPRDADVDGFTQCWLAAPYHAQLRRDAFVLPPAVELAWTADDARVLCELLNPVLADDGMKLITGGRQLLLLMATPLSASPPSFAAIAGHTLPNRPPQGSDGLRLMRLVGEVQTQLYQTPLPRAQHALAVHGLWFWGAQALPYPLPLDDRLISYDTDHRDAAVTMTDVTECPFLTHWPDHVLCLGDGVAAWFRRRKPWAAWWWMRKSPPAYWTVASRVGEEQLRQQLLRHIGVMP